MDEPEPTESTAPTETSESSALPATATAEATEVPAAVGLSEQELQLLVERCSPPEHELPQLVGLGVVIGETDAAVVFLGGATVYSTGVHLAVCVRLRPDTVHDELDGARFVLHPWSRGSRGAGRLLVGFELSDGRRVSTLPQREEPAPDQPMLTFDGHDGSAYRANLGCYLTPGPPPGPLTAYCSWTDRGITETRTVLDATPLVEAADRVRRLWPPPSELDRPSEARPEDPTTGWFGEVQEARRAP